MAAEGEFAFVIAVFAVEDELISKDLYASVVLAVLLSTIAPPFLLRFTISYYNKRAEELVERAAQQELERGHDLDAQTVASGAQSGSDKHEEQLKNEIKNRTTAFLCIQTQSDTKWGLMNALMSTMSEKGVDIIDHRAWAPRGFNTTLVNEVYAKIRLDIKDGKTPADALDEYMEELKTALEKTIDQPDIAKVKVQRWYPGVVEEIVEKVNEKSKSSVSQRLLTEASKRLELKQQLQTQATKERTIEEILGDMEGGKKAPLPTQPEDSEMPTPTAATEKPKPRRRVRQKMRSTPVVGGGLFGETTEAKSGREVFGQASGAGGDPKKDDDFAQRWNASTARGVPAEIVLNTGETYNIRISKDTLKDLEKGFRGQMVDHRGIEISGMNISAEDDAPIVQRLQGYVRNVPLAKIQEEEVDDAISEISGSHPPSERDE